MIRIFISMSGDSGARGGQRIDRIHDPEQIGFTEDQATFIHRKKKRSSKPRREEAIPYHGSTYTDINEITVTEANWLGRMDREGPPPKQRRRLPPTR